MVTFAILTLSQNHPHFRHVIRTFAILTQIHGEGACVSKSNLCRRVFGMAKEPKKPGRPSKRGREEPSTPVLSAVGVPSSATRTKPSIVVAGSSCSAILAPTCPLVRSRNAGRIEKALRLRAITTSRWARQSSMTFPRRARPSRAAAGVRDGLRCESASLRLWGGGVERVI